MVKANVKVEGIAIWYYRPDGLFRVLFPFDENCHKVVLTVNGEGGIPLGQKNQRVNIRVVNPTAVPDPDLSKLMDVTESSKSHDEVRKIDDAARKWSDHGILLTMSKGRYTELEATYCRWGLLEKNGNKELPPEVITYIGQVDLEGDAITIEFAHTHAPITIQDGARISFNNSCPPQTDNESADFEMIYKVIEDKHMPGQREFAINRHSDDKPTFLSWLMDLLKLILGGGSWTLFNNNPLRFGKGLPCNNLMASKSDDLPL